MGVRIPSQTGGSNQSVPSPGRQHVPASDSWAYYVYQFYSYWDYYREPFELDHEQDVVSDMDAGQLVVPFSVGKRRCPGENLARQELSLLIGRLIQKFEIHQDPNNPVNYRDANIGFTRAPIQTPLIFKKLLTD
jgi:cytochrome P450